MKERVRFAPSPTGPLHIGGLRTALFNYLFAKNKNGIFILRLEDTDRSRYIKGSDSYIEDALKWLGINPDEGPTSGGEYGPYKQSERTEIYNYHIKKLIETNKAYYAFDTNEKLREIREDYKNKSLVFKYDYLTRNSLDNSLSLSEKVIQERISKEPYVIRLKVEPGSTVSNDLLRGNVEINHNILDDKILLKNDKHPTYHFANVVDDYLMKITTVIRGEEWLPSLAIHNLIYKAFGWKMPCFIHLPLILKPKGKGKLSKRDGINGGFPVFPLKWDEELGYKELGFLGSGLLNYLALLGWNPGNDKEIFNLKELVKKFSVKGLQKGSAKFDFEKAKWTNQQHLSKMNFYEFDKIFAKNTASLKKNYPNKAEEIYNLIKERIKTGEDFEKEIKFLLSVPVSYNQNVLNKLSKNNLSFIIDKIESIIEKTGLENLKEKLMLWGKSEKINFGSIMQLLRLAIVGELAGPDIINASKVLGKSLTLERLKNIKTYIKNKSL